MMNNQIGFWLKENKLSIKIDSLFYVTFHLRIHNHWTIRTYYLNFIQPFRINYILYIYEKNYSFWQKLYLFWTKVIIRKYSCFYYLGIDFFLYNLMPVIIKAIKQSENDTKKAICIPYKNKSSLPLIYPLTLYPAFWVIEE